MYTKVGNLKAIVATVKHHPTRNSHWVSFLYERYFDSYSCPLPKELLSL